MLQARRRALRRERDVDERRKMTERRLAVALVPRQRRHRVRRLTRPAEDRPEAIRRAIARRSGWSAARAGSETRDPRCDLCVVANLIRAGKAALPAPARAAAPAIACANRAHLADRSRPDHLAKLDPSRVDAMIDLVGAFDGEAHRDVARRRRRHRHVDVSGAEDRSAEADDGSSPDTAQSPKRERKHGNTETRSLLG